MSERDGREWWQDGIIYQIYPRSFADGNGDGIGDLRGIVERLDYLRDLGVDGLWLSPINPSPMHDFGYDVSDYRDIAAEFGTFEDFRTLLAEAHARGIRIVLDLVLNHTSHEHLWFQESRTARDSPKRDWYIWHDGHNGQPPNNWCASFGGKAWEWDEATSQYYLHSFLPQQPDVNWRSPELKAAMWDVVRYWLDMGVDGFRLDVVNWFLKDAELRDNPTKWLGARPYDRQRHLYDRDRPETVEVMKELRQVVDAYPARMTVGEVYREPPGSPALAASYYARGEGLHLAFNFAFLYCKWKASAFADRVDEWEELLGPDCWPVYTLNNHDQPRSYSRYGVGGESDPRARVAAAMLFTLRGTPFIYYGEEIGMRDGTLKKAELHDPVGKRYWPFHPGRDPERTPMQWDDAPHAGFTTGTPWLPVNDDFREVNVWRQDRDPDSLLHWYRALIRLRRREPALHRGAYRRLPDTDAALFTYSREWEHDRIVVLLNFDRMPHEAHVPAGSTWEVCLGTRQRAGDTLPGGPVRLAAYEVLIVKTRRGAGA